MTLKKEDIGVINRFRDGTVIIGSVKGVKLPREINEKIGDRINGCKTREIGSRERGNN